MIVVLVYHIKEPLSRYKIKLQASERCAHISSKVCYEKKKSEYLVKGRQGFSWWGAASIHPHCFTAIRVVFVYYTYFEYHI